MRNSTRKRMIRKWLEGGKPAAPKKDEPMKSWKHAMQDPGFQAIIKLEHMLDEHWNILGCCEHVVESGDNAGRYLCIECTGIWRWDTYLAKARIIAKKTDGAWYVLRIDVNRIRRSSFELDKFEFDTAQTVLSPSSLQVIANELKKCSQTFLNATGGPYRNADDEDFEMLDDWKWADNLPWEQVA